MFLDTFATMNVLYDAEKKTTYAERDKSLDGIANGLRGGMEELERSQAAQERPEPTFSAQREHIDTGVLQDELFRRRRREMLEQAEFNGRFQSAMNTLYDIASRAR